MSKNNELGFKQVLFYTIIACLLVLPFSSSAAAVEYLDSLYKKVVLIPIGYDIPESWSHTKSQLVADVYFPQADTSVKRPLIIFMHGGAYTHGHRNDFHVPEMCEMLANKGYVVASCDYRLGEAGGVTPENIGKVIIRTVQDANSFIRYMKDRALSYHIDTNAIFLSGCSAGAVTCIYQQYVHHDELPGFIDTVGHGTMSGEGNLNGHSSSVAGVIDMWGPVNDTGWIHRGDPPLACLQAKDDPCVPFYYKKRSCTLDIPVYGSGSLHARAQHLGIYSTLFSYPSEVHNIGLDSTYYLKQTVQEISKFCYHVLQSKAAEQTIMAVTPSVFTNSIEISGEQNGKYELFNEAGKLVHSGKVNATLNTSNWPSGRYLIIRKWQGEYHNMWIRKA